MSEPKLPSAEELANQTWKKVFYPDEVQHSSKYSRMPKIIADAIRTDRRAVLEAAAQVQEKYGPVERSDEVAERIRKLAEELK